MVDVRIKRFNIRDFDFPGVLTGLVEGIRSAAGSTPTLRFRGEPLLTAVVKGQDLTFDTAGHLKSGTVDSIEYRFAGKTMMTVVPVGTDSLGLSVEALMALRGPNLQSELPELVSTWKVHFTSTDVTGVEYSSFAQDDLLVGGRGNDGLFGRAGNDVLQGGSGDDRLGGGGGNDRVDGGFGFDDATFIVADDGTRSLVGVRVDLAKGRALGQGNDRLVSIEGVFGSDSDDIVYGTGSHNRLRGNAGDDVMHGRNGSDHLRGGAGDDELYGGGGSDDWLFGGSGNDLLSGGDGSDFAVFALDDNQEPTKAAVRVDLDSGTATGQGRDSLRYIENVAGSAGNDTIKGNGFKNILEGYQGADILNGRGGNDELRGHQGHDRLYGLEGNDRLLGAGGNDRLDGGNGRDTAIFNFTDEHSAVRVDLQSGTAAGQGSDRLIRVENVIGSTGADTLKGNGDYNILQGFNGSDTLDGRGGSDKISGDLGRDTLTGGLGSDSFIFFSTAARDADTITDFNPADDTFIFTGPMFWSMPKGVLKADQFVVGTKALQADHRIIYDQARGNIFYDGDGNGNDARLLIASVSDGTALTAADFKTMQLTSSFWI